MGRILPCRSVVLRIVIWTRSGTKLRATSTSASSTISVMNEYKNGERFFICALYVVSGSQLSYLSIGHPLLGRTEMLYGNSTALSCQNLLALGARKWQRARFQNGQSSHFQHSPTTNSYAGQRRGHRTRRRPDHAFHRSRARHVQ